jgi:hypothetical protein
MNTEDPMTVPNATWSSPSSVAAIPVTRFSGSNPETRAPMKNVFTEKRAAVRTAPLVNRSAPQTNRADCQNHRNPSINITPRLYRIRGVEVVRTVQA